MLGGRMQELQLQISRIEAENRKLIAEKEQITAEKDRLSHDIQMLNHRVTALMRQFSNQQVCNIVIYYIIYYTVTNSFLLSLNVVITVNPF